MTNLLPYVGCFLLGAGAMGAAWLWVSYRAKIKAIKQAALTAAKKP